MSIIIPEMPVFDSCDAFASYVDASLRENGIFFNDDTLLGWMEEYADAYLEQHGVDPFDL